ncbi:hypothetical protein SAMN04487906_1279 [Zhouia amylolytica]|uniref:Cardiolipin synthase N-terminal domain-containing protein n=2 Tax=Zhouia amylolytica TaxID=376730 RepID=W2UP19_9FLAO|nr:hypothetical protein P278_19710 [Zhouia amylolytica AD3]SFS67552.1 hypothetical protein SAMN04487906_1279 [Zhouia amylolytica]
MLSKGQIIFAILFFIAFVGVIIYTYTKDKKLHSKYYKGALWVLVGFILFVTILSLLKYFIRE